MAANGKVIGGSFMDSAVSTPAFGSGLVIQSGLRGRKLNGETVATWQLLPNDPTKPNAVSAVGQAVTEAVLPRFISKATSAAVAATIDSTIKSVKVVRVEWIDKKPASLLKLPESLFTHFEIFLEPQRIPGAEVVDADSAVSELRDSEADAPQTLTEQAFTFVTGIIGSKLGQPTASSAADEAATSATAAISAGPDISDQLMKLASLRDAGILTEEEFATKKAELLSRL